jgi:hypothetical protein
LPARLARFFLSGMKRRQEDCFLVLYGGSGASVGGHTPTASVSIEASGCCKYDSVIEKMLFLTALLPVLVLESEEGMKDNERQPSNSPNCHSPVDSRRASRAIAACLANRPVTDRLCFFLLLPLSSESGNSQARCRGSTAPLFLPCGVLPLLASCRWGEKGCNVMLACFSHHI